MSRKWKPGDVAVLTDRHGVEEVGFCYGGGVVDGGTLAATARWQTTRDYQVWSSVASARPLVVIDAEDREQVERLYRLYYENETNDQPVGRLVAQLQAALREFANPTPPKPEEPPGLGARITDRGGLEWAARTGLHPAPDGMGLIERRWGCLNGGAKNCTWDELCDERGPLTIEGVTS